MLLPPMLVESLPRRPPGEDVKSLLWRRGEDRGSGWGRRDPSSRSRAPCCGCLLGGGTAIDDQLAPSDEGGLIRGEVQDTIGDILWRAYAPQRHPIDPLVSQDRIRQRVPDHVGINGTRMYGVAADVLFGMLHGCRLGEEPHRALRGRVGRGTIRTPHETRRRGDVDDGPTTGTPHRREGVL